MKGSSYIDFAVGAGILVLSLSLTVSYVNSFLPERPAQSAETVFSYFFGGVSHNGLTGKLYKFSFANSGSGAKRAELQLGEKASLGSIIAYDGKEPIPIGIESFYDSDNDGFLEKASVIVQPSSYAKTIDVYYSADSSLSTKATFSSSSSGLKPLGEEEMTGIYKSKIASFGFDYDSLRNTVGISSNFRLSVKSHGLNWSYGPEPRGNVARYSRRIVMQESDGKISFAEAAAEVW